jgi:hypothetical protein
MEHKRLTELNSVADLKPALRSAPMSRRERLERWAELLEREPDRLLKTLEEIEWKPKAERRSIRADGSPLSVAFADPVLRSEGLASDRLGDAVAFFQISEHEAHLVLCSCNAGETIPAGEAARRIRGIRAPKLWSLYWGWPRF